MSDKTANYYATLAGSEWRSFDALTYFRLG